MSLVVTWLYRVNKWCVCGVRVHVRARMCVRITTELWSFLLVNGKQNKETRLSHCEHLDMFHLKLNNKCHTRLIQGVVYL